MQAFQTCVSQTPRGARPSRIFYENILAVLRLFFSISKRTFFIIVRQARVVFN